MSRPPIDPGETRALGRTGVRVTRLGFGGAPLGNLFRPIPEAVAVADRSLANARMRGENAAIGPFQQRLEVLRSGRPLRQ